MNLDNELKQRKQHNKAMRDLLKKEFPKALNKSQKITPSKKVGKFLHIINYSDLGNSWDIKRFIKRNWECDKELKRLFSILNYGDSTDEMKRLIKELKSIIKQGKANGTAIVDMGDLNLWYGDITITQEKWWFENLEKTFFGE